MNLDYRLLPAIEPALLRRAGILLLALGLAGGVIAFSGSGAYAQSNDVKNLLDRIERLQRELATLQRHVYRGEGGPVPAKPHPLFAEV